VEGFGNIAGDDCPGAGCGWILPDEAKV